MRRDLKGLFSVMRPAHVSHLLNHTKQPPHQRRFNSPYYHMKTFKHLALIATAAFTLLPSLQLSLNADEPPSNAELFKMLKATQKELELLRNRTEVAESEASRAKAELRELKASLGQGQAPQAQGEEGEVIESGEVANLVGTNAKYSYEILDHTRDTNTKQLLQLEAIRDDQLQDRITIGGNINVLANYQKANKDSKFGWLMRHPTAANQFGNEVSEAVIHSVNLQVTGRVSDRLTAYAELLYNPEQNFASGSTITGLPRNNVNMRRAYLLYGDLGSSPFYASIGKMDIPFGLNDTVSPFTNSTNWHSFAGLAYGAQAGYVYENLHLRAMAIQGGAQFRNANTSVHDTNIPSKLNNFAFDANYTFDLENDATLLAGLSYQHGTAYCQDFSTTAPFGVQHFEDCMDNNPGMAGYLKYMGERLTLIAEYAQTLDEWPGTHNPNPPLNIYEAEKNTTFTLGAGYDFDFGLANDVTLSAEFSRFIAGDDGSPWEKQDQIAFGASYFLNSNVKLFTEYIHVDGWVPLNFLSGGNTFQGPNPSATWSDQESNTDVIVFGATAAF